MEFTGNFTKSLGKPGKIKPQRQPSIKERNSVSSPMNGEPSPILMLGLKYAYTLSTTTSSDLVNDYSIGKQIPYVPRYQVRGHTGFRYSAWEVNYVLAYTGYRFVTTDESQYIKPFTTSNIFTAYTLDQNNCQLQLTFHINNILNVYTESIVGRIMPGRNFALGLLFSTK